MKILTLLVLFFSWTAFYTICFSQCENPVISGNVLDTNAKESLLEDAVVSLMKAADSSLVKTQITEADGKFFFEGVAPGDYLLFIKKEGYQSASIAVSCGGNVSIRLKARAAEKLDEVAIVARIPLIQRKIDRTVVNVDAMISTAGNNVLELLSKSPGVIVDQSGSIMLKGKPGVQIYVDDKPTYLSGDALQNYLKAMPASAVSQIEIMTNPPAKYDAAGNVGIINIVTKKSRLKGFNANLNVSYGQGKYFKNTDSFNFNYRNNKFNVFGTLSGGSVQNFSDLYINRTYLNEDESVKSFFNQNTKSKYASDFGSLNLGTDYYVTDKTTFGFKANGMFDKLKARSRNVSLLSDPANVATGTVIADNGEDVDFRNGTLNLNMRHKFDTTGKTLTMDLDYVHYNTLSRQFFLNNTYAPAGDLLLTDGLFGNLPAKIDIYAYKADYSQPVKGDAKFEAGIKTSYTDIDNLADYYTASGNDQVVNYDLSNHFKYREMINAGYLNFNKQYKRFGMQLGLRAEGTISSGNQLGNPVKPSARFQRDYLSAFPTAFFTYDLDSAKNHQLAFSYGRRIDRPFYQDLNPFVRPLDKFTFYSGNPLMRPMFSQNLSFTYSFKSSFSTSLSYVRTKNEINETIEIDATGLYFSRPGNIGRSEAISLSVNGTIPVGKWLTITGYSEVTHNHYVSKLYTETLDSRGTYFYFNLNNSFQLGKGWSAELSGYYISRVTSAQFTLRQRGQVYAGVQKKILKDKGSVRVMFRDVFYTELNRGMINNLRLTKADYNNRSDSRAVFLTFTYSFGKPFVTQPKHEGSGSESEQNRVKGR